MSRTESRGQWCPSYPELVRRVAATPEAEAFRYPHGDGWASVTTQQVDDRVRQISAGLISLGIAPRIGSRWHRRCDTNGSSSTSP
jgi:long-subunit acyl-CoA synthetase (AMP-forming)